MNAITHAIEINTIIIFDVICTNVATASREKYRPRNGQGGTCKNPSYLFNSDLFLGIASYKKPLDLDFASVEKSTRSLSYEGWLLIIW